MTIARTLRLLAVPLLAVGCGPTEQAADVPSTDAPAVTTAWRCEGAPELWAEFYSGSQPTVRLVRAGESVTGVQVPSASGARYDTADGRSFWIKGRKAILVWPEGVTHRCALRKS